MTRRVLVAGGAGFLGSHLCRRLAARGDQIICLDDLSSGVAGNVADLMEAPTFRFVVQDVADPFDAEVDVVCNLACPASPPRYQADPIGTMRTCVVGALNLLDLARRQKAVYLQASTSEVYGDPEAHPQHETYVGRVNPIGPRACYDEGKRAAEALCSDYQRVHGLSVKVARIFNTYGPAMRADDGRVVCTLISQALRGEPLTLFGDGRQTRSFCYVDDLIEGLLRLIDEPPQPFAPVNLGAPYEVTMRALAELVLAASGSTSPIITGRRPPDDPQRRRPDISRARERLGWAPTTSLAQGLAETVSWFRRSGAVAKGAA